MPNTPFQRIAITVPTLLATQIDAICASEGRNRSEFFREAVRSYLMERFRESKLLLPSADEEQMNNPAFSFTEWHSADDSVYDSLR